MGSVEQSAAKLPSVKLCKKFDPGLSRDWVEQFKCGMGATGVTFHEFSHFFLTICFLVTTMLENVTD